ncbi:MAG: hypothetical protein K2X82_24250 [Gemmataceae bacterium]|nr:hypothetical protein [Gemmataceae bacterium]
MADMDDGWTVRVKPTKADIPYGPYQALFLGAEDCEIIPKGSATTEPRRRWSFRITAGPLAGTVIDTLTERKTSDLNKSGRLVAGFKGGPLKDGDRVKAIVDEAVGKPWTVVWGLGPKGGVGIQMVSPSL